MSTLHGKVALITGAANGIGAATARGLAARGVRLILVDAAAEPLAAVAAELDALGVVADVRDLAAVQAAVDAGVERFGGIDLVLANAGIGSFGSVLATDPDDFRRVLEVNVLGVFHTVRAALPSVLDRKGYVLVVSSLAAFVPAPTLSPYNASKAGVEHFANTLRVEVAAQGVAVGCAHMSWIDTPMLRRLEVGHAGVRPPARGIAKSAGPHVPGDRLCGRVRRRLRTTAAEGIRALVGRSDSGGCASLLTTSIGAPHARSNRGRVPAADRRRGGGARGIPASAR